MWISSRLHCFDKKSFEFNFLKKLCINTNSFSTTSTNSARQDYKSFQKNKPEIEDDENIECL